jgi:hypothetical protein
MSAVKYTVNSDKTIEKWYLEKMLDDGEIALRKTPTPKYNCCMRFFKSENVYESAKEARTALKTLN